MTIKTVRTNFEGRSYDVAADSDKRDFPFVCYVEVYRIRKDGSRGYRLTGVTPKWRVWATVSDQFKED